MRSGTVVNSAGDRVMVEHDDDTIGLYVRVNVRAFIAGVPVLSGLCDVS